MLAAVIAACTFLAALCAAAEHALDRASRARIDDMLHGEKRARIDRILERQDELALASIVYRSVFETAAVVLLAVELSRAGLPQYAVIGWSVLLVIVAAELLPRTLVAGAPETALVSMLPAFHVLAAPLFPIARGLLAVSRRMRRSANQTNGEEDAADEILSAVTEGEKEGSIAEAEADMIENIIELRDADVSQIMTPRPDISFVDVDDPLDSVIRAALESGHSRLPVFQRTRDNVVGVLYVRDLIAAFAGKPPAGETPDVRKLMRRAHFVPETMRIRNLIHHFQETSAPLAIVVDEYGGTAGLVTISSIVNAIVGEVPDQDQPRRQPRVKLIDPNTIEADARTPVRRLNEDYGTDIPESEEYDTVAGYLFYTMGKVPKNGDRQTAGDATEIVVLNADERRVLAVRIIVKTGIRTET